MNKLLQPLLTCSILSALIASCRAYTEITAWGVGPDDSGPLYVTTVSAELHGDYYVRTDWDVTYYWGVIGQDEFGNNIFGYIPTYTNPRNVYRVSLPDDWLGRSISISWDGAMSWTAFSSLLKNRFSTAGSLISARRKK